MNKVLYIAGIGLSVVFVFVIAYFSAEIADARLDYYMEMMRADNYSRNFIDVDLSEIREMTMSAGFVIVLFIVYFLVTDILGLTKIKTSTTKVLSILGICFSGFMLLWDMMMISNPGAISFDEVGIVFFLYALIMLAFMIVGVVQSFRYDSYYSRYRVNNDSIDLLED